MLHACRHRRKGHDALHTLRRRSFADDLDKAMPGIARRPGGKKGAASAHRHATQADVSGPLPVPRREIAAVRRLHVRRQIARVVEWQRTRLAQHFEVGTLARRFQIRFGTFDFLGV
jgi:hypothetical protein